MHAAIAKDATAERIESIAQFIRENDWHECTIEVNGIPVTVHDPEWYAIKPALATPIFRTTPPDHANLFAALLK